MFRSGLDHQCAGLKLACVPHIARFDGGHECKLARTLAAVRFTREPHEKIPSEGFDMLMRRDNVMDIEVYLALYDMQDLRDYLYKTQQPYVVNLVFHSWLFPELSYRQSAEAAVEAAIFESSGVYTVADEAEGLVKGLRRFDQKVWVKDKVYMCMGPDSIRCRVDRHRLICTFLVSLHPGWAGARHCHKARADKRDAHAHLEGTRSGVRRGWGRFRRSGAAALAEAPYSCTECYEPPQPPHGALRGRIRRGILRRKRWRCTLSGSDRTYGSVGGAIATT